MEPSLTSPTSDSSLTSVSDFGSAGYEIQGVLVFPEAIRLLTRSQASKLMPIKVQIPLERPVTRVELEGLASFIRKEATAYCEANFITVSLNSSQVKVWALSLSIDSLDGI